MYSCKKIFGKRLLKIYKSKRMKTMKIKRWISVLLCMLLCISSSPTTAFASGNVPDSVWTDYAADEFAGGTGTRDDPYQIATAEQLAKLAKMVNSTALGSDQRGIYFKLTANIDLSAHRWVPIGYGDAVASAFSGFFDGGSNTITGMVVDETANKKFAGLFGVIAVYSDDDAAIKNLTVENASVTVDVYDSNVYYGAGILVGCASRMGNDENFVQITNCHVSGNVTGGTRTGGFIGAANFVQISDSTAEVTVKGHDAAGGFVGIDWRGSYKNCLASGTVDSSGWSTGGFVGEIEGEAGNPATIEKCIAKVDVSAADWNLGGFAGRVVSHTEISNSIAYGDVTSNVTGFNPKVGGFAGTNMGKVTDSHALGTVTENAPGFDAGGFVGSDGGGITSGCSFSSEKNSGLNAIGHTESPGTNDISDDLDTNAVLANVCEDYYGGHQYSAEWTVDTEATCTTDGSKSQHCERCDAKINITAISATGHNLTKTEAKAATHTAQGNTEYWYCDVCDKYFRDEAGTKEISQDDIITEKLSEHTADTSKWDNDETNHWNTCECGEKLNTAKHTFIWVTDKEATKTEKGEKHEECEVCHYKKAAVEIPAGETLESAYKILEGADQTYRGSGNLTVKANGDFSKFTGIKVDGAAVDASHYEAKAGSTVATLKENYLLTLSPGKHKLTFVYKDGEVSTNFTIAGRETPADSSNSSDPSKPSENSPKTGDDTSLGLWVTLFALSVLLMVFAIQIKRHKICLRHKRK